MLSGSRSPALPFWEEKGHLYLWESGRSRRCRWKEGLEGGGDSGTPRRGRFSSPAGRPPDTRETRPERGWDLAGVPGRLRTLSGLSLLCAHPSPLCTSRETLPRQLWPRVFDQRAPVPQGPLSLPPCAPDSLPSPLNSLLKGASSPPSTCLLPAVASPTSHHPAPLSAQPCHPVLGKPLCLPPSTCPRCDYASPGASQGRAPQRQPSLLSRVSPHQQGTLSIGGDQGVSVLGLRCWLGS